ncbi:YraN family protein [Helicobacter sp.]|uniref:YraN family protein n=1 Tax=Helicobacter sp. TaxID=218 RepID=UPI0025C1BF74|nr:YraN family protein [Helicobacter sp.]MBR2494163.1 YraN family protein [Helicobacter sp.]
MSSQKLAQSSQKQTHIKGRAGEQRACEWLESKGFKILARNYCTQFGEIDIIALHDNFLHFIEVKTFAASSLSPRYAITSKKLQKIYASIDVLLFACHNLQPSQKSNFSKYACDTHKITQGLQALDIDLQNCQYCVDALLIWGNSIELLENISLE